MACHITAIKLRGKRMQKYFICVYVPSHTIRMAPIQNNRSGLNLRWLLPQLRGLIQYNVRGFWIINGF